MPRSPVPTPNRGTTATPGTRHATPGTRHPARDTRFATGPAPSGDRVLPGAQLARPGHPVLGHQGALLVRRIGLARPVQLGLDRDGAAAAVERADRPAGEHGAGPGRVPPGW